MKCELPHKTYREVVDIGTLANDGNNCRTKGCSLVRALKGKLTIQSQSKDLAICHTVSGGSVIVRESGQCRPRRDNLEGMAPRCRSDEKVVIREESATGELEVKIFSSKRLSVRYATASTYDDSDYLEEQKLPQVADFLDDHPFPAAILVLDRKALIRAMDRIAFASRLVWGMRLVSFKSDGYAVFVTTANGSVIAQHEFWGVHILENKLQESLCMDIKLLRKLLPKLKGGKVEIGPLGDNVYIRCGNTIAKVQKYGAVITPYAEILSGEAEFRTTITVEEFKATIKKARATNGDIATITAEAGSNALLVEAKVYVDNNPYKVRTFEGELSSQPIIDRWMVHVSPKLLLEAAMQFDGDAIRIGLNSDSKMITLDSPDDPMIKFWIRGLEEQKPPPPPKKPKEKPKAKKAKGKSAKGK